MKRIKLLVILVPIISILFAGLYLGCAKESGKITVIMPRHEMDLKGVWEKQTREFEAKTGIKVEFIQMSWDEVDAKIRTDLAAGGTSYDVIELDNGNVAQFASAGWIEPLDSYASGSYVKSLVPGLVNAFKRNGDLLGIVWNNDTRFFFYNQEMLKKAGFESAPKSWDEVVSQSEAIKKAGICAYPIAEYWNQEWALANSVGFYLYSFGGNYFDADGKITINSGASVEALQFMTDMIRTKKLVNPSSVTLSQEAAADLFYQGKSAFFFQGPPSMFSYSNDIKKSKVVGKIAAASALPAQKPEFATTLTLPEAFSIPKGSKNKKSAWKYIEFMISKEKDKERATEIGSLPLFSDLYSDPDLVKAYPFWKQLGEQAKNSKPLVQVEWYGELVEKTIVAVQQALLGKKDVQAAADEIAAFLAEKSVDGKKLTK